MNTPTLPAGAYTMLNERFWVEMHEMLSPEFAKPDLEMSLILGLREHYNIKEPVLVWLGEFNEEVFGRVKAELQDLGHLHFSEPTRLSLMYLDATNKHSAAVKREFMGPNATRRFAHCLGDNDFRDHDFELDIKKTSEMMESKKRELLGLEIDFLAAHDARRFDDALSFLRALQAKRRTASLLLRAEVNNWQLSLAMAKLDLDLFLEAWGQRDPEVVVDKMRLAEMLQRLLYATLLTGFAVSPSRDGELKMKRQGQQVFAEENTMPFLKASLVELAEAMLVVAQIERVAFKQVAERIFVARRKTFLAVNPLIRDIQPVWK